MSPRPANPGAHEALLEAARVEFGRNGLDRARVEDIARRAGISKGAFYLHFASKEAAFEEILQRFLGALEDHARRRHEAEERFRREAGDGVDLERLIAFECASDAELLEIFWGNRHLLSMVESAVVRGFARIVSDFRRHMREVVSARIRVRQERGHLRDDVDPEVVATIIVGTYEGFGRRMSELKEKPDLAAWSRSVLVVLYEGALARPAGAARAVPDPLVTPRGSSR